MDKIINDKDQITNRLIVLYILKKYDGKAPLSQIQFLFQSVFNITDLEWKKIQNDIISTQLVIFDQISLDNVLTLSDEGLVVLSFFSDRIPEEVKIAMDRFIEKNALEHLPEIETQYDSRSNFYYINVFEDNFRNLTIKIQVDEWIANELDQRIFEKDIKESLIEFLLSNKKKSL